MHAWPQIFVCSGALDDLGARNIREEDLPNDPTEEMLHWHTKRLPYLGPARPKQQTARCPCTVLHPKAPSLMYGAGVVFLFTVIGAWNNRWGPGSLEGGAAALGDLQRTGEGGGGRNSGGWDALWEAERLKEA